MHTPYIAGSCDSTEVKSCDLLVIKSCDKEIVNKTNRQHKCKISGIRSCVHFIHSAIVVSMDSLTLGLVLVCLVVCVNAKQPNILLVIADDYGWNDIGYHGSEIKTPTLDR